MAFSLAQELDLELEMSPGPSDLDMLASPGFFGMSLADELDPGVAMPSGLGSLALELDPHAALDHALERELGSISHRHTHGLGPVSEETEGDETSDTRNPDLLLPELPHPRTPSRSASRTPSRSASRTPHSRTPNSRSSRTPQSRTPRTPHSPPSDAVSDDEAAAADAIAALRDSLDASRGLVGLLRTLDAPNPNAKGTSPSAPGPSRSHPSPASPRGPPAAPVPLEQRLQAHMARLSEAERARDEQTREAALLLRDLERVAVDRDDAAAWVADLALPADGPSPGWTGEVAVDGPARVTNGDASRGADVDGLEHDRLESENRAAREATPEGEPDLGHDFGRAQSNGTPYTRGVGHGRGRGRGRGAPQPNGRPHMLSAIVEPEPKSDLFGDSTSPISPLYPASPTLLSPTSPNPISPTSPTTPTTPTPFPPRTTPSPPLVSASHTLMDATSSLATSLGALHERAALALAMSQGAARQLRGIRVRLEVWREREAAEDACRRAVDEWEAHIADGHRRDVRGEMREVMRGFGERLDEVEGRLRGVRVR